VLRLGPSRAGREVRCGFVEGDAAAVAVVVVVVVVEVGVGVGVGDAEKKFARYA